MRWRAGFGRFGGTPFQAAVLSLALNLAGLTWGLPFRLHPDEKAVSVARLLEKGTVIPESFINPSLPLLIMAPAVALQDLGARLGLLGGLAADPLLVCRLMSALAAALAVWLFGATLARFAPEAAGASFLLAAAPALVNVAHFATPESWLLLGTVATLFHALRYVRGEGGTGALGLVFGLTLSCKYTAAALAVPVALAVLLRTPGESSDRPTRAWLAPIPLVAAIGFTLHTSAGALLAERLRGPGDARLLHPEAVLSFVRGAGTWALALAAVALVIAAVAHRERTAERLCRTGVLSAAGFILGTPGAVLAPLRFLTDLAFNAQTRVEYKGFKSPESSWGAYAHLLSDSVGLLMCLAAASGVLLLLLRPRSAERTAWITLASGASVFVLVAASGHQAMRFLVPALPCAAWFAARGFSGIRSGPWRKGVAWVVGLATLAQSLLIVRLFFVDSRLEAGKWMAAQLGSHESWGLVSNFPGYGPSLPGAISLPALRVLSRELAPEEATRSAASQILSSGPDWIVLPEPYFGRFMKDAEAFPEKSRFFAAFMEGRSGYELAARFRQGSMLRPPNEFLDPELLIFRRAPR